MPDKETASGVSFVAFGDLLRHLRQRAGLTQQEFGLAVGYSHAQVARLEGGKRLPDVAAVRSLFVEALGLQTNSEMATRLVELASESREDAPTKEASQPIPQNLPTQRTSFIGRERELGELKRLLASTRLLALTGSGGTGKTRLALQLAADVADDYPNGIWLVELAPISDPAFVLRAIAAVLGVREVPDRPLTTSLLEMLRGKQLLLLLDNCEHLIDACARFADDVLRSAGSTRILATSREGLGIAGEVTFRVPSLQTPSVNDVIELSDMAQYEAVRLFVDRAANALPGFTLTATNAPAVRQICYRLDGIPLAIELAAARVKALSPEKIAERLNDRFRLLTGGSRTALPRQQTLRGAIDWSYSLLTDPERTLLRRLSVFAGGWTLEACEVVCAGGDIESPDILDLLTRLVDKSLVVAQSSESSVDVRYRLLETIRQYARERLADTEEGSRVRDRHLDYFVKFGTVIAPQLHTGSLSSQMTLVKRLEMDMDNVRGALEWAMETQHYDQGLQLTEDFFWMWILLARQAESLEWNQRFLAQGSPEVITLQRANALNRVAWTHDVQGEWEQATAAMEMQLSIGAALNNPVLLWQAYEQLARMNMNRGQIALAREYVDKAQATMHTNNLFNEQERTVYTAYDYGWLAFYEGDYMQAQALTIEWHTALAKRGEVIGTSSGARVLGYIMMYKNEVAPASIWLNESLVDNAALGDKQAVAACFAAYAALALTSHDLRRAAHLFGASEALSERIQTPLQSWDVVQVRRNVAALRERMDEATLNAVWAEGRAMTMEQAMTYALAGGD